MTDKRPFFKSILYYPSQLFAIYQQKINQQQRVLAQIQTVLPAELAHHILHCVQTETKLLLYTDSAVWSSQLRFFQQSILNKLHDTGYKQIVTLQIKVVAQQTSDRKQREVKIPCKESIELIRQHGIQQTDRNLNRALLKLSDTLNKLSDNNK